MKRYSRIFTLILLIEIVFILPGLTPLVSGQESGGEILKWDVDVGTVQVPQTTDAAEDIREENMEKFEPGTGAYFGFTSCLEPWEFLDLNLSYPDAAWLPMIPYYFGANPTLNSAFSITGTTSIWDSSGGLVVRTYSVKEPPNDEFGVTNWYTAGTISRCWEDWMSEGVETNASYMGIENTGIGYFLRQVHLGGVVGGTRMQELLAQVNAQEVSIQRTFRDERIGVFYIPSTAWEWDNWIADLYVWVNMRNWKIERHQVDLLYGRELCEYYNVLWEVQPDLSNFYLEWLPIRVLDELNAIYDLEITTEEPDPGPDEYVEHDQWIRINGSNTEEESPTELEEEEEPESGEDNTN